MYKDHSGDLLARCAYANLLFFRHKVDEIPAVFNGTFDLTSLTKERCLPLVTFLDFARLAADYYFIKVDDRFMDFADMMMEADLRHDKTRQILGKMLYHSMATVNEN